MRPDPCTSPGDRARWRHPEFYDHLCKADRRMFAWEWLRRSPNYREAWLHCHRGHDGTIAARAARRFGLAALEDPARDARVARPVWRSDHDPRVVAAEAASAGAAAAELFDIRQVAPIAHVAIGEDDCEHWLLSNGSWLIRLDIVAGTLLGGPALLRFKLEGLASLPPRLSSLCSLVRAVQGPAKQLPAPATPRTQRWISELRTADALEQGATHREIAQVLFGEVVQADWRGNSDAFRLRVQRLARTARRRLRYPLSRDWFDSRLRSKT